MRVAASGVPGSTSSCEGHQLARHPRLLGEIDEELAALGLLDLVGAGEQRFEIADIRRSAPRRS